MNFTVLLIDDEAPSREELRYLLKPYSEVKIIGEACSGREAVEQVSKKKPDVLFLDIQLSDMDGFEVARRVFSNGIKPIVVFATAYDEYAVKAFEVNAVDYVLKPFSEKRLKKTVLRLINVFKEKKQKQEAIRISECINNNVKPAYGKICLWKNDRMHLICPEDICYCEAIEKGSKVKTESDEFITHYSLSKLQEKLSLQNFIRTHRSYLVNFDKVKEIIPWFNGTFILSIEGCEEDEVPVSRRHAKEIREMFEI